MANPGQTFEEKMMNSEEDQHNNFALMFFSQDAKGFTISLLDFLGSQAQVGKKHLISKFVSEAVKPF